MAEAIESALVQTHPHVEVIVVDDGSIDDSLSIVQRFGARVRWQHQENQGGCSARNMGVALAEGDWIQFLDADDLLDRDKLRVQLPISRQSQNVIVYCDYNRIDINDRPDDSVRSPTSTEDDPVVFVLKYRGLTTAAPLHDKASLQKVGGFRVTLPCSQERDLHLRLACAGYGFLRLPEKLLTVRRQSASVSADYLRVLEQHEEIVLNAMQELQETGAMTPLRRKAFAGFCARDARALLQLGETEKAKARFRFARQIDDGGGMDWAYSRPARHLQQMIGAEWAERLIQGKRRLVQSVRRD